MKKDDETAFGMLSRPRVRLIKATSNSSLLLILTSGWENLIARRRMMSSLGSFPICKETEFGIDSRFIVVMPEQGAPLPLAGHATYQIEPAAQAQARVKKIQYRISMGRKRHILWACSSPRVHSRSEQKVGMHFAGLTRTTLEHIT
jgi:hypothetical protein